MMIFRLLVIGFFSLTALSVFTYQGIEVLHAVADIFRARS